MEGASVGGAWPATLGHDSGREEGEKEQGGPWGRSPAAARPEAVRGGLATAAGGVWGEKYPNEFPLHAGENKLRACQCTKYTKNKWTKNK